MLLPKYHIIYLFHSDSRDNEKGVIMSTAIKLEGTRYNTYVTNLDKNKKNKNSSKSILNQTIDWFDETNKEDATKYLSALTQPKDDNDLLSSFLNLKDIVSPVYKDRFETGKTLNGQAKLSLITDKDTFIFECQSTVSSMKKINRSHAIGTQHTPAQERLIEAEKQLSMAKSKVSIAQKADGRAKENVTKNSISAAIAAAKLAIPAEAAEAATAAASEAAAALSAATAATATASGILGAATVAESAAAAALGVATADVAAATAALATAAASNAIPGWDFGPSEAATAAAAAWLATATATEVAAAGVATAATAAESAALTAESAAGAVEETAVTASGLATVAAEAASAKLAVATSKSAVAGVKLEEAIATKTKTERELTAAQSVEGAAQREYDAAKAAYPQVSQVAGTLSLHDLLNSLS